MNGENNLNNHFKRHRKVERKWFPSESKILIALAEERTALWNIKCPGYKDREAKEQLWKEISEATNHSVSDCKVQWNTIRSRYNNERNKFIVGKRNGITYKSSYELFEKLRFLDTLRMHPTNGNNLFDWTEDAVLTLIDCWRNHECLYNDQHDLYAEKSARLQALNEITNILCTQGFNVNTDDVRLKISNLRGLLTKEMKRMQHSNDQYRSTAYWYSRLDFLQKFIRIPNGHNKLSSVCEHEQQQNSCSSLTDVEDEFKMQEIDEEYLDLSELNNVSKDCSISTNQWEFKNCDNELENSHNNFLKYIAAEMKQITDEDLQDELRQAIVSNIFQFKKRQRLLHKN